MSVDHHFALGDNVIKNLNKLLLAMKDYIEQAEILLQPEDPAWSLAYAIENGDMPTVYYEVLDALSDLGSKTDAMQPEPQPQG